MGPIIILLQSGIGDDVMAIPLLKACKEGLRADERLLILACQPVHRELIAQAIGKDPRVEIRCIGDIWFGPRLGILRLALRLRRLRPKSLLLPQSTDRWPISLFSWIVNATITVAPDSRLNRLLFGTTVARRTEHKVKEYLRFGESAGLRAAHEPAISLTIPPESMSAARTALGEVKGPATWIGFAPGSGTAEAHKRWPPTHWRALGELILQRGADFRLAIVGGPEERAMLESIRDGLAAHLGRVITVAEADALLTAAVLRHCACVVSACSGTLHLAAAVGAPVLGLYGPTNPGYTGPYSERARIARVGLACSPCYRAGFNRGCGEPACMTLLEPSLVAEHLMSTLNREYTEPVPWHATTDAVRPSTLVSGAREVSQT